MVRSRQTPRVRLEHFHGKHSHVPHRKAFVAGAVTIRGYRVIRKTASISKDGSAPSSEAASVANADGLLIRGDNLSALHRLAQRPEIRGRVALVYIDPPFGTGQDFTVTDHRVSTISRGLFGDVAYPDDLSGAAYLDFLRPRLLAIKSLMADDGSIYVHIDCKVGHYVKCLMDEIFGRRNFINDITRIKCNPKNFSRKGYGNVKDIVLFYGKTRNPIWNDLRQPIQIPDQDDRFRSVDTQGRRYTTTPLHAPGETLNGQTGKPWRGIRPPPGRHWRYSPSVLEQLDEVGLIEWSSTGNPRKRMYADDVARNGVKIQDVWTFKDPQNPRYPTEKNLEMLRMIISNSSRLGDVVLDAFCGSGTTLVAANSLGRQWIGIDASPVAIAVVRERFRGSNFLYLDETGAPRQ